MKIVEAIRLYPGSWMAPSSQIYARALGTAMKFEADLLWLKHVTGEDCREEVERLATTTTLTHLQAVEAVVERSLAAGPAWGGVHFVSKQSADPAIDPSASDFWGMHEPAKDRLAQWKVTRAHDVRVQTSPPLGLKCLDLIDVDAVRRSLDLKPYHAALGRIPEREIRVARFRAHAERLVMGVDPAVPGANLFLDDPLELRLRPLLVSRSVDIK